MQHSDDKQRQTWRLTVAYNGSDFHGWQAQDGLPTVQGVLHDAFKLLQKSPIFVKGAGRTDAGVHAVGQTASCVLNSRFTERKLILALSSILPDTIRVMRVEIVPDGFNAKVHSIGKCYRYHLYCGDVVSPFRAPFVWHIRSPLDLEAMRRAASYLEGEHNFESFRSMHCDASHARRYVWRVSITENAPELTVEVRGNAFCRNMVRIIVGTLIDVGRGKIEARTMLEIIAAKERVAAGMTAPAKGLCLEAVYYPDTVDAAQIPDSARFPKYPWDKTFWPPQPPDELK
jgi:tRNA pseudouridine38-40 synthase